MRFNLLFYCFFLGNLYEYVESEKAHAMSAGSSHAEASARARSLSRKTPKIFHQQTRFQTQFPEQYHDDSNSFSLLEALLVVAKHKNKSKRRYYLSCSARVIYGHELFAFRNRNINRFEYLFQQRNAIKALCENSQSNGC